jgi:hypothetical protein
MDVKQHIISTVLNVFNVGWVTIILRFLLMVSKKDLKVILSEEIIYAFLVAVSWSLLSH